jgi:hypothetical protein
MYSVTTLEGSMLALSMVAMLAMLVLGVMRRFPRAIQTITAGVDCPVLQRRATAELARDEWTRRLVDVTYCSVLGSHATTLCRKSCLRTAARSPRFTRS